MADDPGNLLIRSQFGDWPKDCLAQVHASGDPPGHGEFFGHYYRLKACDRLLGPVFRWMRNRVFPMVALEAVGQQGALVPGELLPRWRSVLKQRAGDWLTASGLWEVIFHIRISESLERFITDFHPDVIFCEGYSLGFTSLPLLIARRFNVPICFQTTDDWPQVVYRWSPIGWILRRRANELMRCAKVRLAFGEKMQQEYQRRYGLAFGVTYHLDDPNRFPQTAEPADTPCRIIYTGSLAHRRYEALQDIVTAVRRISDSRRRFEILAYSNGIPKNLPPSLLRSTELTINPLPTHEQLPAILAKATMLLLPESFTAPRQAIEYSISTKAHLYMMSGRPVLVYGPAYSGTVDYATRERWGLVVSERSESKLIAAISEIAARRDRLNQFRRNAQACIRRHHDLSAGRERLRLVLDQATNLTNPRTERAAELAHF